MSNDTPANNDPESLPGTVWTRADALRIADRVFVRHDDQDLWALVTAIELTAQPDAVRLRLTLELDGTAVGTCEQTPTTDMHYMRQLPSGRAAGEIPATTGAGLAAATLIYRQNWDRNGTVAFSLPTPVARQILGDRGWQQLSSSAGTHWRAPNGERFWETDEALRFALTAECVDSPAARTAHQS